MECREAWSACGARNMRPTKASRERWGVDQPDYEENMTLSSPTVCPCFPQVAA